MWFCDSETEKCFSNFYKKKHVGLPQRSLYILHDAEVREKGIITLDNCVIKENLEGSPALIKLQKILSNELEATKVIEEPILYLMRIGLKNYGHCLTQIIPRIHWFYNLFPNIKIIVHKDVPKQIFEALALIGITQKDIMLIGDEHVKVKKLYFIDFWNHHFAHSPKIFQYIEMLKKNVISKKSTQQPTKKLFINRNDAATRHIINHNEVAQFLKNQGFLEISCGNLSFEEQIEYFASAEEVVGISGAAMSNIVFCQPETKIVILSPNSMASFYFWDVAHHAKVNYSIFYFESNKDRGIYSDFSVNLDVLKNYLAK